MDAFEALFVSTRDIYTYIYEGLKNDTVSTGTSSKFFDWSSFSTYEPFAGSFSLLSQSCPAPPFDSMERDHDEAQLSFVEENTPQLDSNHEANLSWLADDSLS